MFRCNQIKRLLALWVGNDLTESEQADAQRHMATCPHCRDYWQELRKGHQVIEQLNAQAPTEVVAVASVWPDVRARLAQQKPVVAHAEPSRWGHSNQWLPVSAVAAACLVIFVVNQNSPPVSDIAVPGSPRNVQPISSPAIDWRSSAPSRVQSRAWETDRDFDFRSDFDDGRAPLPRYNRKQAFPDHSDPRSF